MQNILHLSDLHLSIDDRIGFNVNRVDDLVEKLVLDIINVEKEQSVKIDSIFITGDLAFSGKREECEVFCEKIVNKIVEPFNISRDDVYIVPGNHDCDRSIISNVERKFRGKADVNDIDELFHSIDSGEDKWERLEGFNEFVNEFHKDNDDISYGSLYNVRKVTKNLYVICANTAWLAQDDSDKGLIAFSKKQVTSILRSTPKKSKKFF